MDNLVLVKHASTYTVGNTLQTRRWTSLFHISQKITEIAAVMMYQYARYQVSEKEIDHRHVKDILPKWMCN